MIELIRPFDSGTSGSARRVGIVLYRFYELERVVVISMWGRPFKRSGTLI